MIDPKQFRIYVTSDKNGTTHPFLVIRQTEKNGKGRYVDRGEIYKAGLCWPNSYVGSRDELAMKLGQTLLAAIGV